MNKCLFFFFLFCSVISAISQEKQPNVLFIAVDDLNDWIGVLDGNVQAQTPNIDRFANQGSVVFKNAVCPAPVCGPSRSAILSGFMPNRTGVYGNSTNMIYADLVKENATLPEYFSKNGYHSLSNGKIFHKHGAEFGTDFGHWAFDEHARARRYVNDSPNKKKLTSAKGGIINGEENPDYKDNSAILSWGPTNKPFEETVDYKVADWASEQLGKKRDKPFFMAVGFIKPHLPWFVPQEFFDLYDLNKIKSIEINENDLVDIIDGKGKQAFQPSADYNWIKKHKLEKEATRAYLANISYVDKCLGIVFDALDKSEHANNTIVVIWGDHGWHLGEKLRYLKETLWSEAVKTPFIVRLPGMKNKINSNATVNLIDMYPTLVSLCNLPKKSTIDGNDISPLLKNPLMKWDFPGVTISSRGTSVMSNKWHYISYLSGAEELYDLENDPMEWENLILEPRYVTIVNDLKKWVPKTREKSNNIQFKKQKNYVDADSDPTIKPTRKLIELH